MNKLQRSTRYGSRFRKTTIRRLVRSGMTEGEVQSVLRIVSATCRASSVKGDGYARFFDGADSALFEVNPFKLDVTHLSPKERGLLIRFLCEKHGERPAQGMSVLGNSLLNQTPGAVPMIFDVGPIYNECVIAPSGTGMSGHFDKPME